MLGHKFGTYLLVLLMAVGAPAGATTVTAGNYLDFELDMSGLSSFDFLRQAYVNFSASDSVVSEAYTVDIGSTLGSGNLMSWAGTDATLSNYVRYTVNPLVNIDGIATIYLRFSLTQGSADVTGASLRLREDADSFNRAFAMTEIQDVPLPAGLPLMLGGALVFATFRRRR